MGWFSAVVLYIVTWWMVFYIALTIRVKVPEEQSQGHATSAPQKPNIKKRILLTSLVTFIPWGIIVLLISQGFLEDLFQY